MKRLSPFCLCLFALTLSGVASAKAAAKKRGPGRSRQSLPAENLGWLGHSRPGNVAKFYASGPHTFFDIAPLKYGSWDEYAEGVKASSPGYKSAKFTLNDDARHPSPRRSGLGDSDGQEEMTTKAGKVEMGNFRWTVVFENQDGKWLIVHEHVSEPCAVGTLL